MGERAVARVLITDDSSEIRHLVAAILVEQGHTVAVASSGFDALGAMEKELPDLLVLDVMMPRMDGYEVLERMQETGILDQVKVVVLTAKSQESDWVRGYKLGADHYLTKPFLPEELEAAVDLVLQRSKEDLAARRADELDRAQLLSRLESILDSTTNI